ncbi:MAG: VanZ family protein [Thermodesulfobacteriota bacterium]
MIRFLPLLLLMAAIFYLSHSPGENLPPLFSGADKLCHLAAYGALAGSVIFALRPRYQGRSSGRLALTGVIFCLLHGISDEIHQMFIPGRTPSLADIGADTLGAALISGAWLLTQGRQPGRNPMASDN